MYRVKVVADGTVTWSECLTLTSAREYAGDCMSNGARRVVVYEVMQTLVAAFDTALGY